MSIKDRIQQDMKDAMRAKDKARLGTIRLILAAIKQREVDERIELDDEQVIVVLDKMAKQRRESISQFEQAGRDDLIAQENFELGIIQPYLPEALGEDELNALIDAAMAATGANSIKDMGKVMGALKSRYSGQMDFAAAGAAVKELLSATGKA